MSGPQKNLHSLTSLSKEAPLPLFILLAYFTILFGPYQYTYAFIGLFVSCLPLP